MPGPASCHRKNCALQNRCIAEAARNLTIATDGETAGVSEELGAEDAQQQQRQQQQQQAQAKEDDDPPPPELPSPPPQQQQQQQQQQPKPKAKPEQEDPDPPPPELPSPPPDSKDGRNGGKYGKDGKDGKDGKSPMANAADPEPPGTSCDCTWTVKFPNSCHGDGDSSPCWTTCCVDVLAGKVVLKPAPAATVDWSLMLPTDGGRRD